MKITPIESPAHPLLKKVRGLHQRSLREKSGQFLLEGAKIINEALGRGLPLKEVLVSQSFLKEGLGSFLGANIASIYVVEDKRFEELSTTESSCRVLAVAPRLDYLFEQLLPEKQNPLVVIADGIQDPGNLGTLMRTALAAGATGMVLGKGTVDAYNPKVVRSAAGALFKLPFVSNLDTGQAIQKLKQQKVQIIACDPAALTPYGQANLTQPLAVVFGNEGQGLSPTLLSLADATISIAMNPESESLNVAVSAGIILFSARQQRLNMQEPPITTW